MLLTYIKIVLTNFKEFVQYFKFRKTIIYSNFLPLRLSMRKVHDIFKNQQVWYLHVFMHFLNVLILRSRLQFLSDYMNLPVL